MKKAVFFVLLVCTLLIPSITEGKVVRLPDLVKPNSISVYKNSIYITDGPSVYKYSLKDLSLERKFGKEGNGPKEFRLHSNINKGGVALFFKDDQLVINSILKLSFFTINGNYINEIKTSNFAAKFIPFKNKYVGTGTIQDLKGVEYSTLNFYNMDLLKIKEIHRQESWDERKKLNPITFTMFPIFHINDNKIFVNRKMGEGKILVFNNEGNKVNVISHSFERLKVTGKDVEEYKNFFNRSPGYKGFLESYKKIIKFPDYFPVIRNFHIDEGRIYILTFEKNDRKNCYIFKTDGTFLSRINLNIPQISPIQLYPYTTHQNKIFKLVENLEAEEWELNIDNIN